MEELEVKENQIINLRTQADNVYKLLIMVYGKAIEYQQLNNSWFLDWTDRINKLSVSW